MRPLAPVERRVALLVASRTLGLAWLLACTTLLVLSTSWTPFFVDVAIAIMVMFAGVPLVLAPRHEEMSGPGAALWLQKPVGELRFVFARLAESMAASVALVVLLGSAALACGHMLGWQPPRPLSFVLPVGVLTALVTASMAFGTAAWLSRGSRAAVVALMFLSLYAYLPEMADPEVVRGGLAGVVRLALFPTPELLRVVLGMTGDLPWRIQPLLACLAYAAAWIVLGTLGVLRSLAAGGLGASVASLGRRQAGASVGLAPRRRTLPSPPRQASLMPMPRESKKARRARAAEVYERLAAEYPDAECALRFGSPFELAVATILSAQCTDARVNMVTPALFRRYPDARALAGAEQEELEELIRSTGFFRNKARSLLGMATAVTEDHGGELPRTMKELAALPGVGRKTANVILGNAFGIDEGVAVDTHVKRLSRLLGFTAETNPDKIERDLTDLFPRDRWTMLTHVLIFHGRQVCPARRPRCNECAVSHLCPSSAV